MRYHADGYGGLVAERAYLMVMATMSYETLADPTTLLDHLRARRLPLVKRLSLLGQLADNLDARLSHLPSQPAVGNLGALSDKASVEGPSGKVALPASEITQLLDAAYAAVQSHILPRLRRRRLRVVKPEALTAPQAQWLRTYFWRRLYPLLTPLAVDPARPFPLIRSGAIYLLVTLRASGQFCQMVNDAVTGAPPTDRGAGVPAAPNPTAREVYGLVELSTIGPRLVAIPAGIDETVAGPTLLWREEIVRHSIALLFPEIEVTGVYQFRVLCASNRQDCAADENAAPWRGGLRAQRAQNKQRPVTHIEVEQGAPPHLIQWLTTHLHAAPSCVFPCPTPLSIADFCTLIDYLH